MGYINGDRRSRWILTVGIGFKSCNGYALSQEHTIYQKEQGLFQKLASRTPFICQ